jgi:thiamine-phosphate pyrophosphorylase
MRFQLYYITDRSQLRLDRLEDVIARAIAAGVDWVQIREKDLPARDLLSVTQAAIEQAQRGSDARVIVNDRLDVALAARADGVHLGTRSMPSEVVRRLAPQEFLLGVSCHSLQDALAAQSTGADYILLGPIFPTPSKLQYGPPLGLPVLREVTSQVSIPVFALGGINPDRIPMCRENGAAGVAAIRLFQESPSLDILVRSLRPHENG